MTSLAPIVHVVDDDASVRTSLGRLLRSAGYSVESFSSANEFLAKNTNDRHCCLILDLRMPGLNGMELQEELVRRGMACSIVFITGHGDIKTSVQAMKNGAIDFLSKPYDQTELLSAVEKALKKTLDAQKEQKKFSKVSRRLDSLTEREREVMQWVISGRLNKQIALQLGCTEKTVKAHRGKVMEKMRVSSVAELVRLAEKAKVVPAS